MPINLNDYQFFIRHKLVPAKQQTPIEEIKVAVEDFSMELFVHNNNPLEFDKATVIKNAGLIIRQLANLLSDLDINLNYVVERDLNAVLNEVKDSD